MSYLFHIVVFLSIYAIVAYSLDLLAGHTGLLSLAQAGFFGIGAYSGALLAVRFDMPVLVNMATAAVITAAGSLLVSLPSLRLHDDYFVIATFAFQALLFSIFNNWIAVTRGPQGIPGIPRFRVLGHSIQSDAGAAVLSVTMLFASGILLRRLLSSPFGRVLHSIREDELFTQSLGKSTVRFKLVAFAVSAFIAGCAGCLYAQYVGYVDPTAFTINDSILILSMIVIGGLGTFIGPIVGTAILVVFPEILRFAGITSNAAADLRQMFYGGLLILVIFFRPYGIAGRQGPEWR